MARGSLGRSPEAGTITIGGCWPVSRQDRITPLNFSLNDIQSDSLFAFWGVGGGLGWLGCSLKDEVEVIGTQG